MLGSLVALLLAAIAPSPGAPGDAAAVPARAIRAPGEITDDVWRTAPAVDAFVQREPEEGGRPSQRTEFRVVYDASTLFVRVHAFDTDPSRIVSYLTRRDDESPSDWIRVLVDSYHDRRTAYEFAVNPAGVKQDRYWFNDTEKDDSWDAVWDVKVTREADGWTAEFRIPFSQLRFNPGELLTFGLAVSRSVGRLNETSTWPLLSRSANGYVSSFGELVGLSMRSSVRKLELVPYVVSSVTRQHPEGNPLLHASAGDAAVGLDVKYALTPGLTFTSTFNPDFGQVEADPAVVN
ncbi:MAG: carbohydrate binding family 9 domain-containing protein, partial [Acidobacteria bacterium]|nr:carbohydrate binding family 9 domain-containing protein [Acidobacteriota bacterium]